ncbi:hypothetical protein CAN33_0027055 [Aspergillus niger]|uniref:Uncharacterized protein n=1 Tax=Aspergillus niger TaxID=5061 RepID=A0A505I7H2_ASPNG|nr:hypothetical protein CAN33_0027055 [Aspergillus niger]
MSAEELLANVEGGVVPVTCHEDVLRIAFIYLDEGLWTGNGVFDVVDKLHSHGLSFGEGVLRFNRSLDIFYLAQLAAAIYRYISQLKDDFPSFSDFPAFYIAYHAFLHSSAWRSYYSYPFLTQRTTARFYRMPDLQDLPDSSSPLCQPRHSPASLHILKIPRWAYSLSTLEATMTRLHTAYPSAPPYSEAHARFWLDYFTPDPSPSRVAERGERLLRERFLGELKRRMVQKGRTVNERAGKWTREALEIMEPYVREWQGMWPGVEERGKMLRRILVENAQLFARWRLSPTSKQFTFALRPRE